MIGRMDTKPSSAQAFIERWRDRMPTLLDTLVALGRARAVEGGRWVDAGA